MRIYRCFHDGALAPGGEATLSPEETRHLSTVRRAGEDETVLVLNGRGVEATATILAISRSAARLRIDSIVRREDKPDVALEIAPAMTRTDAFEDAFERAIELGITAFRPTIAERTVVKLDPARAGQRVERWHRLAVERIKQCERLWLPEIAEPSSLESALAAVVRRGVTPVALVERQDAPPLSEALAGCASVCLFTGPEGGWSPGDLDVFSRFSHVPAGLGEAILRAETAILFSLSTALAHRARHR